MAEMDCKRYTCEGCNTLFDSVRAKRYCTRECNKAHLRKIGPQSTRAEYIAKTRENSASKFHCEFCGIEAHRRLSGTNKAKGFTNRWCSMKCRHAQSSEQLRILSVVAHEVAALRRIAAHIEKPMMFRCGCTQCGAEIIVRRNKGLHRKVCDVCKKAIQRVGRSAFKRKQRADGLNANTHRKRARKYGVAFDPSVSWKKVFDRDKWRCHMCGIKTPKSKRGSIEPDAPELDHVIALSNGGSHTWDNVKCSCRRCNGAKGAATIGQMGLELFGA